ncbi:recombinase family protein [Sinirhodobacter sp. HNIBRBA609]|nr:recombinase family protein [Sinirhodobacter sp. HNIBRBA609]
MSTKPAIRCAIYTRKSSDEGLEQEFNSLDAQHEACAAYVASQRHEGWKLLPERYDDGGLSGGTLERPALQRLLAEIDTGRIGMVVVYKIDRLTRSLPDFVRLVERLEAKGCSFVSVTQAFNTSSSMGRLTLNVLLSFAQFEREVTAERIRDKIAASKQKGLWMGGTVPLGYRPHPDPQRRELIVVPDEARTVAQLFALYDDLGNLRTLEAEAARLGLRPRTSARPGARTDAPFSRGQLHYLLTNPVYLGRIRHKTTSYPGLHPAIVTQERWDRVQERLQSARSRPRGRSRPATSRPLLGKLRDETGDILTPSHTQRNGRRFSYYVSHRLISGTADPLGWRLPAQPLETTVRSLIARHLRQTIDRHALLAHPKAREARAVETSVVDLITRLETDPELYARLLRSGALQRDAICLQLDGAELGAALGIDSERLSSDALTVNTPLHLRRRGVETRIVTGERVPGPDPTLLRILAEAHGWAAALRAGQSLTEIARKTGHSESYLRTRLPLAFLAPALQSAILEGRQRTDRSVAQLLRDGIPLDWAEQQRRFG